jgi:hypothetical protein
MTREALEARGAGARDARLVRPIRKDGRPNRTKRTELCISHWSSERPDHFAKIWSVLCCYFQALLLSSVALSGKPCLKNL